MSLTQNDLRKIGDVVYKVVNASSDCINARIDKMEENINHRLDENDRQHDIINAKIDRLSKRTDEDIVAVIEDVDTIKVRLKKAGI